jgi:nuclear pore complex protein Nup85
VDLQYYGLAVAWYGSAEDWPGLGRTVERILDEYITKGASVWNCQSTLPNLLPGPAKFSRLVEDVASSLAELQNRSGASAIFVHRLRFAVAYAEFHKRRIEHDLQEAALILVAMFQQEIAPKSWWGVLLCDAVGLLQFGKLSNVTNRYSYHNSVHR